MTIFNSLHNWFLNLYDLGQKNGQRDDLPEALREPKPPDVTRNASVIPENWALTRTPSTSSDSESEQNSLKGKK